MGTVTINLGEYLELRDSLQRYKDGVSKAREDLLEILSDNESYVIQVGDTCNIHYFKTDEESLEIIKRLIADQEAKKYEEFKEKLLEENHKLELELAKVKNECKELKRNRSFWSFLNR